MEDSSPESPSKKRKHQNPQRDPPLFASRRSRPTLQQLPDFLTESVNTSRNTSYIPTPKSSPEKSPTPESLRARPRQVIDHPGFANAFQNRKLNIRNENLPPNPSRSPLRTTREMQNRKISPGQTVARSWSPSQPHMPTKSKTLAKTPSPSRGRSILTESPANSESSPGRGYAEAYQRIVEEENLAQEDSLDDLKLDDFAYSEDSLPDEGDRLRTRRRRKSASPVSLHTLRRASSRVSLINEPNSDETANENGAIYEESHSESIPPENDTQTSSGSGASQYARDIQRLNNALKGNGQAFSRARVRQNTGSSTPNLRRSLGSNESLGSAFSTGSLSHQGSDPSINIPKAWGRKAKPGKDWLNRINSQSGRFTGDTPQRSKSGSHLVAQSETHKFEEPEEDIQLRSSSLVNGSSSGSTPRTSKQYAESYRKKPQWVLNDDEFTGRSLQVSESPPMRIQNATRNGLQTNDTDRLRIEASTKDHQVEQRDDDSASNLLPFEVERIPDGEFLPERSRACKLDDDGSNIRDRQKVDPSIHKNSTAQERRDTSSDSVPEEMGRPIPDSPIVVYSKGEDYRRSNDRAENQRGESENLLRRLARVSSKSPSPSKEPSKAEETSKNIIDQPKIEETPQPSKAEVNRKTPLITGGWVEETPKSTLQISEVNATLKTPFVTGAWVDTPIPTGGRGPPLPTPSDPETGRNLDTSNVGVSDLIMKLSTTTPRPELPIQEPLKYTGPPLPKSALEEIINDAKSGKLKDSRPDLDSAEEPTLNLGESTIQSLEDLVANDTDYSTLLPTSQETSPPTSDPSPSSSKEPSKPDDQNQDPKAYTNLLLRLRDLGPSIRASTRQLASLERTVTTANEKQSLRQIQQGRPEGEDECHEAGEFHDFIWPCPRCNCPGRNNNNRSDDDSTLIPMTTINIMIPRLWHWPHHSWRPRLTWLGLILFCIYAYFFLENWARMVYCHPAYAYSMVGYGVDINAPRPPFVLFKVLYTKLALANVLQPIYYFSRTILRISVAVIGYVMGFVFNSGSDVGATTEKQPVSRDERIPRPSWGPDLSMFDDEYL